MAKRRTHSVADRFRRLGIVLSTLSLLVVAAGVGASAHGNRNAGDTWVDNVGQPPGPGHEMDPHLQCADINLWGAGLADPSGTFTIDGWHPSGTGAGNQAWPATAAHPGNATWTYSGSGSQVIAVINVEQLLANARADGDAPVNKQGFHFKLQFSQDPQKHKTFWVNCPDPTPPTPTDCDGDKDGSHSSDSDCAPPPPPPPTDCDGDKDGSHSTDSDCAPPPPPPTDCDGDKDGSHSTDSDCAPPPPPPPTDCDGDKDGSHSTDADCTSPPPPARDCDGDTDASHSTEVDCKPGGGPGPGGTPGGGSQPVTGVLGAAVTTPAQGVLGAATTNPNTGHPFPFAAALLALALVIVGAALFATTYRRETTAG